MLSNFCTYAQDGSPAHPYPIGDISTLISFAQCINNNQPFAFEDGKFVFDIEGNIPAGGAGIYFEQTADKPALFCYPNGHISNLTIVNPVFSGTINYGGALATFVMGGTIDSCHVTGNNLVFNGKDCGALIGWVGNPNGNKAGEVTISHCSNSCNITSNRQQESFTDYYNSVAGVVACIKAERYHVTRSSTPATSPPLTDLCSKRIHSASPVWSVEDTCPLTRLRSPIATTRATSPPIAVTSAVWRASSTRKWA